MGRNMGFFTGEHIGKIDAKGRLMLPARFKAQFPKIEEHEVVLRMGFEANLQLYPLEVYRPQHEKLSALSAFDPQQRALRRYFFSRTVFLSLDGQGRLLVARNFLSHASLRQKVLFLGVGDHIEIWSPQNYEQQTGDTAHYSNLAKQFLHE